MLRHNAVSDAREETEAISAAALTVPAPSRKLPSDAIAVVETGERPYVVLFDPRVLRRKTITMQDVLGYATAEGIEDEPRVDLAAAEPGYGYLLYATLAGLVRESAKQQHGNPYVSLKGSYSQTKYARRFWDRQPGRALKPLSDEDFRRQFGTTYRTLTRRGERLVERVSKAENLRSGWVYDRLKSLGSEYFTSYYGVSAAANRLGPDLVPRPVSPREGIKGFLATLGRPVVEEDLALITPEPDDDPNTLSETYLIEVPKGSTSIRPENILATVQGNSAYARRFVTLHGRLREAADNREMFARDLEEEMQGLLLPSQEHNLDKHERMFYRGDALREALRRAGFVNDRDTRTFFEYMRAATDAYVSDAQSIAYSGAALRVANPRKFPLSVPIFMPI